MLRNIFKKSSFTLFIGLFASFGAYATDDFIINFDDSNPIHGQAHRTFRFFSADIVNPHLDVSPILRQNGSSYPGIPIFLPEDPTLSALDQGTGIAHIPLCGEMSNHYLSNIPGPIKEALQVLNIANANVRLNFVSQTMPWNEESDLYFRPHFGIEDIPEEELENFRSDKQVSAGIFYSDTGNVQFIDDPGLNEVKNINLPLTVRSYPHGNYITDTRLAVERIRAAHGQSLWSFVSYRDQETLKAIVTLHWLLDVEQAKTFVEDILNHRPVDQYPSNNYHITRANLVAMIGLLLNKPAFEGRGGHILKFNELLRNIELQQALAIADWWPARIQNKQAEAGAVIQILSQCDGGIEAFQGQDVIEITRSAYRDFDIDDREVALKLVLLGKGLINPREFKFPGNACNIVNHVMAETLRIRDDSIRDALSVFSQYIRANGISVEQALHNAADYRLAQGIPKDDYGLPIALKIRHACELRDLFLRNSSQAKNEKRAAINAAYNHNQINLNEDRYSILGHMGNVGVLARLDLARAQDLLRLDCRKLTWDNPLISLLDVVQAQGLRNDLTQVEFVNCLTQLGCILEEEEAAIKLLPAGNHIVNGNNVFVEYSGQLYQKYISDDDFMNRIFRLIQVAPGVIVGRDATGATTLDAAKKLFALELINVTEGRCNTGVFDGISALERRYLPCAETDDTNLKAYYKIANRWMEYVNHVIDLHASPIEGDDEYAATSRHIMRQRFKQVFPIGDYEHVAHFYLGRSGLEQNKLSSIMFKLFSGGRLDFRREIRGEDGWPIVTVRSVDVPALTVSSLVDMMYESLTEEELRGFVEGHPKLRMKLEDVFLDIEDNHFFTIQAGKALFKKTVVLMILHELGFVQFDGRLNIVELIDEGASNGSNLENLLANN